MYLAGVSVRRVEDVTELLWGRKHVRGRRWLPRDPRCGGRREREQGMLEIVPAKPEGTRLEGGEPVHLGQAPGHPGIRIGGLPGCQMAAQYKNG